MADIGGTVQTLMYKFGKLLKENSLLSKPNCSQVFRNTVQYFKIRASVHIYCVCTVFTEKKTFI